MSARKAQLQFDFTINIGPNIGCGILQLEGFWRGVRIQQIGEFLLIQLADTVSVDVGYGSGDKQRLLPCCNASVHLLT